MPLYLIHFSAVILMIIFNNISRWNKYEEKNTGKPQGGNAAYVAVIF
jgi:hypothetical protein